MNTYIVRPNQVLKLKDTQGTLKNIDYINSVELSNSSTFQKVFVLRPHRHVTFGTQLWARLHDNSSLPVELHVIFGNSSNDSSDTDSTVATSSIATDAEFLTMIDDVFSGNTAGDPDTDTSFAGDIDDIFAGNGDDPPDTVSTESGTVNIDGEEYNVISDADFNSMLDDLGI